MSRKKNHFIIFYTCFQRVQDGAKSSERIIRSDSFGVVHLNASFTPYPPFPSSPPPHLTLQKNSLHTQPWIRRLPPQCKRQQKKCYRNDTIIAFFFEATWRHSTNYQQVVMQEAATWRRDQLKSKPMCHDSSRKTTNPYTFVNQTLDLDEKTTSTVCRNVFLAVKCTHAQNCSWQQSKKYLVPLLR